MSKKKRRTRHTTKWRREKPDEVVGRGPIRMERYGKYIAVVNDSTPEEHAEFLEQAKVAHKENLKDLQREVDVLQGMIKKYDPVELMHRAAYMLLPVFMKNKSESEFDSQESYYLPTVEYLQYLIARTEVNTDGTTLSEEEWETIWDRAKKVLRLTETHLMTRETDSIPPSAIDELRFGLDFHRLMVRVKRYSIFLIDYFETSLAPYEQQLKEIYAVDVDEVIEGLRLIDEYQKTGVIGRYRALMKSQAELSSKLREKGYAVTSEASPEEIQRTSAALDTEEFKSLNIEVQEQARLTFTSAIFDITDLTTLPKPFLSLLSVRPGESILSTLTGPSPDYEDLSPLSPSVLHYRPFLENAGKFYTFYHSGFEDRIAEIVEADLFQKRPGEISIMAKKRSDRMESDAKTLLASITKPDFALQNVYYPNPDDAGNLTEVDVLLGVDDILFLVEVKSGKLSSGASRGAPKSLERDLSDLIIEGQRQSERAERYIKSSDQVAFWDESGELEVHRIKHSEFRKIFRVIVTRENLGWIGAKIAVLSVLEPNLLKSFPWHVAIDDLRTIAALFNNDEIRFVHYLEQRLEAAAETKLSQTDEIGHIALYHQMNHYHQLPVKGGDRVSYDTSFMLDIDHYFMKKATGENPDRPTQQMSVEIKKLIEGLRNSRIPGRFEAGAIALSLDDGARGKLTEGIMALDSGKMEGRRRSIRLPLTPHKIGLSITYMSDAEWHEELKDSAVQMVRSRCERWLVVQLTNESNYKVSKIEIILPGRFSDEALVAPLARHDERTEQTIAREKTGRNDPCPCGSGKKYKKCHLRIIV